MQNNLNKELTEIKKLNNLHHFTMTARPLAWQRSVQELCGTFKLKRKYKNPQGYGSMNTIGMAKQSTIQHIKITAYNWQVPIIYTPQVVNKWQDDIGWWLEIIRLPDLLLPKKPQIIFTTNKKQRTTQLIHRQGGHL